MNHPGPVVEEGRSSNHLVGCGDGPQNQGGEPGDDNTASAGDPGPKVFTDQDAFVLSIHSSIVDYVQPVVSGLLDVLCEVDTFSSEDEQFIREGVTRREKARRFSTRLRVIKEEDFVKFLPALKRKYPHVVVDREFLPKEGPASTKCLRHAMKKRINLKRLLDILLPLGCCHEEDYGQLQVVQFCGEKEWNQVFQLLQKHASNPQVCQAVKEFLQKKKFDGLEDFQSTAVRGFTCTCFTSDPISSPSELPSSTSTLPSDPLTVSPSATPVNPVTNPLSLQNMPLNPPTLPLRPLTLPSELSTQRFDLLPSFENLQDQPKEFDNHHETAAASKEVAGSDEGSSAPYPSSVSSKHHDDLHDGYDSGITSISEGFFQPFHVNDVQFQTAVDKKKYREVLGQINKSLAAATYTRTELRYLEMIRDDARTLSKPAKDETEANISTEKLHKLWAKGRVHQQKVDELYKLVLQTWQDVQDIQKCLEFECPTNWNSLLMIRYHLLRNEVRECHHISERAHEVLEHIREIYHNSSQPQ